MGTCKICCHQDFWGPCHPQSMWLVKNEPRNTLRPYGSIPNDRTGDSGNRKIIDSTNHGKSIRKSCLSPWLKSWSLYSLVMSNIAVGNHHVSWENPLFLWPCSMAMLRFTTIRHNKRHAVWPDSSSSRKAWIQVSCSATCDDPRGRSTKISVAPSYSSSSRIDRR